MLKRIDKSLGRFWGRLDRVVFAKHDRLDDLLCSNWFVPFLLFLCLMFPLLAFV